MYHPDTHEWEESQSSKMLGAQQGEPFTPVLLNDGSVLVLRYNTRAVRIWSTILTSGF